MIAILAEFLELLGRQPNTEVPSAREVDGLVVVEITCGGERATLVANASLPPVTRTRSRRPEYGAYTIHQLDYPDWIKGNDPAECVAHVLGWFDGVEARLPGLIRTADLSRLSAGTGERPQVGAVMAEIANRSALRVTGVGRMTSLDGQHEIVVEVDSVAVRVLDGSASYSVTAGTVGVCAAAILGFTDGFSLESDD